MELISWFAVNGSGKELVFLVVRPFDEQVLRTYFYG